MNMPDDFNQLMRSLDDGVSLPASWYTDATITELEIERIFRRSWQYVGTIQELNAVDDYVTAYVGKVPIVAVKNENGIEAFVNVCRHRRHEVMKGCGNSVIMQCPYHAWTYDLTGCLKAAPRADREPGFDVAQYPLISVRLEQLGPFVFVNLDPNAVAPLKDCFGEVLGIIADTGIDIENLQVYSRTDWSSRSNWKTMLENYLECYHCPVAHPGFSAAIDVDPDSYRLEAFQWFFSQRGLARRPDEKAKAKLSLYDTSGEISQSQYHLLWPNCTININPGFPNLSIDVWNPDGPNQSQGFSTQFFAPGVAPEWAEQLVRFNHQVGHEDDELTDSVQRGLTGGIPDRGKFLVNSENLIVEFQKLVAKSLACAAEVAFIVLVTAAWLSFQCNQPLAAGAATPIAEQAPAVVAGFQAGELEARFEKPKIKDLANKVLNSCVRRNFEQAMTDGLNFADAARPRTKEIVGLTETAERLVESDRAKSAALHIMAYQSLKKSGRMTADQSINRIYRIVSILGSVKTSESDRVFANDLLIQALQTRNLAGGIRDSDAPAVLLHAKLEFSLKRFDKAIKEYEYWIGMYESKGKNPPPDDLPDALAEQGISYTNLKDLAMAEKCFTRACEACMAVSDSMLTPGNKYDVEDFLIYNYLSQGKLDIARQKAKSHLTFKEKQTGFRSSELADELNRYADLFEQAGDGTYAFSLRTRAGRVAHP